MHWLPVAVSAPARMFLHASASAPDLSANLATYILGYGPVGAVALVLAWVLYRGLFVLARTADKARAEAVGLARADLLRENERLLARAEKAEEQRDEAMRFAQDRLAPLATSFTVTMSALLPLLQEQVSSRERTR